MTSIRDTPSWLGKNQWKNSPAQKAWLSSEVTDELIKLAREADGNEICGYIKVVGNGFGVHPITNVSEMPAKTFEMHEQELIDLHVAESDDLVGIYHSHPGGNPAPSKIDFEWAPPEMRYWIVTYNEVYEWDMTGDEPRII